MGRVKFKSESRRGVWAARPPARLFLQEEALKDEREPTLIKKKTQEDGGDGAVWGDDIFLCRALDQI